MRVVSWNVNGIRAAVRKGLLAAADGLGADLLALQEVRATVAQLPAEVSGHGDWRFQAWAPAERPGYSGVGVLSRRSLDTVAPGLGERRFDLEGRVLRARLGRLTLVNAYFPNGNGVDRDLSRIPFKLAFYRRLRRALQPLVDRGESVLLVGDFNTAHTELDLARPRENAESSGFRPEEREAFAEYLDAGWVDTFRHFTKEGGHYSWWTQRGGARARNVGWRIDYVLASPRAMEHLRSAALHPHVLGSDHCPVSVDLDDRALQLPKASAPARKRGEGRPGATVKPAPAAPRAARRAPARPR